MTWALAAMLLAFQGQPPAQAPAGPGAEGQKPAQPETPKATEPAKPKVLENAGKPMLVEPVCGTAEIQDFGMTCSEDDPCPVYLELASVEAQGAKLFLAGNLHAQAATLWSVLLVSEDGAKTFAEPYARIRTGSLDQLQFVDAGTGFVSGHLAQNLPKDPFLLRSTDGGKTWKRVALFTDPEIAVIDHYLFNDRNNGMLILDRSRGGEVRARYQRYETNTSGDVWGLRETSPKPIALKKREAGPGPEWRLRADARAKAYRVERRSDQKWVVVASFRIDAGGCKPDPPPPPPEPPPPEEPAPQAPQAPKAPNR